MTEQKPTTTDTPEHRNFGWNYVDVVGEECKRCVKLFFDDDFVAVVTNGGLASKIRFVSRRRE